MAGVFAWLAQDEPVRSRENETQAPRPKLFATPTLCLLFMAMSFAFGLRDFTGSSMGSLGSLFLQTACGFDPQQTGMALSAIFLASVVSNPLFGHLSDRGRIRWTFAVLLVSVVVVGIFPRVPAPWLRLTMMQAGSASAARTAFSALRPSKRRSPLRNTMPCIRRQPGTSSSPSLR